jgi:uncharacterized protein (DUF1330 family)
MPAERVPSIGAGKPQTVMPVTGGSGRLWLSTFGTSAVNGRETVKIQYTLPLAVAIGLGFGAVALHARTTTPPVYVVVEIDEITDANGFEALRQTAAATAVEVQSEDGRYFASTENVTAVDGSAPKFFAFIAFDNMTKAKTFIDSMKTNTALRTKATKSRSFIVEGTSHWH